MPEPASQTSKFPDVPLRFLARSYDRIDLVRILGVAALYLFLAKTSLIFATVHDNVTILWLPSDMALATLLILGKKLWLPWKNCPFPSTR